jgi:hypothetical protein
MARGSNSRDGRTARSEIINRAYGSPLKRDKDGVFKDEEGNTYTDERAYGMITKEDLKELNKEGRVARSESEPPSYRQRISNAFFDVAAVTRGFKFGKQADLTDLSSKLTKGLANIDDEARTKLFDSFKSKGETGYFLDKETVEYAKKEASRRWDEYLSKDFAYLKAEFPEDFKEFTKDWAFSPRSVTPTVEAKAKDIFLDAVVRRVSALVNGAKGGDDGKLAVKNYERMQQYAPYEYKANQVENSRFKTAVRTNLNESVQIARDAILSRLVGLAGDKK